MVVLKDKIISLILYHLLFAVLTRMVTLKTWSIMICKILALTHDGSAIYIADSFNNVVKYSISGKKLSNFIGGKIGDDLGKTNKKF